MERLAHPRLGRRSLLGFGAAAIAGGAVGVSAIPAAAAEEEDTIRVGTFNIHHGSGGDNVFDLEHIARVIEEMDVDVIGLQEVDRHWSERSELIDEPRWFARRLGMRVAYGANLDLDPLEPGQRRRQYGTAVLSRYPIVSHHNTFLPMFEGHEQRGLLETVISVGAKRIRFANTHLQHNDNLEREAQAAAIIELLGTNPELTFLVGDINAVPGTPEMETLADVFVDSWAKVGDGPGYTIPVEAPTRRIDYIFSSDDLTPLRAEVITTDASDHLPVVADFKIE